MAPGHDFALGSGAVNNPDAALRKISFCLFCVAEEAREQGREIEPLYIAVDAAETSISEGQLPVPAEDRVSTDRSLAEHVTQSTEGTFYGLTRVDLPTPRLLLWTADQSLTRTVYLHRALDQSIPQTETRPLDETPRVEILEREMLFDLFDLTHPLP